MKVKKAIKTIGKCFIALKQENEGVIGQFILVVDNGYSAIEDLNSTIKSLKEYFPKAEISVLALEQRKFNIQKEFAGLLFIIPSQRLIFKRYRIALQMLKMRRRRYDLIVLFSLDVTPLVAALIFLKGKALLYNQWKQWWSLRLRNINEIFKITCIKQKERFNVKNFLKKIGLFFVLLNHEDEEILKYSILVIDNGYASFGQIDCAIQRIKESLPLAKISVLGLEQRKQLKDKFPDLEIIRAGECIIKKYRIARHMLKLRKIGYDEVILLSLDTTPIIVSVLFMNTKVLLYNQWHQWWSLKPKPLRWYLLVIPTFILNIILNSIIFIYLLINISWIFLKKSFNVFRFSLLMKKQ